MFDSIYQIYQAGYSRPAPPFDLHKCWPPHTQFDISPDMNRSIFYIIGVIVVIVIVLKLLGLF